MITEVSGSSSLKIARWTASASQRAVALMILLPLTYALFGATWMGFVPLMPELRSALGIEPKQGTLLITVISMAKSVVPILTGIVAARFGMRSTLLGAGVLIVAGGLAPWLGSFGPALALRFVLGVGGAMWVTLMSSVVLAEVPAARRPVANGMNAIAANIGVIAALALTLPLAEAVGGKVALSIASVAGALCVVAIALIGPIGAKTAKGPQQSVAALLAAYAGTLKLAATWWLALAFCGPLALYLVLNTFLGAHLEEAYGLPRAAAMRWLSFMNVCGVPAAVGSGLLLARRPGATGPLLVAAAVLLPLGVVGAVLADSDSARALCFAVAGIGTFLPVSPLVGTLQGAPGQTPARLGMIFGSMFAFTYLASAVVPTLIAEVVARGVPLGTALLGAALLGATPAIGLMLLRTR